MAPNEDTFETNDVILRIMGHVLEMTEGERLDLLNKLKEVPVKNLSLGERNDSRKEFDQTITFTTQDRQYTATCKDISSSGIFIKTEDIFQTGQIVSLEIPYSDTKKILHVPAEIVRVDSDGIGLRFIKKEHVA